MASWHQKKYWIPAPSLPGGCQMERCYQFYPCNPAGYIGKGVNCIVVIKKRIATPSQLHSLAGVKRILVIKAGNATLPGTYIAYRVSI